MVYLVVRRVNELLASLSALNFRRVLPANALCALLACGSSGALAQHTAAPLKPTLPPATAAPPKAMATTPARPRAAAPSVIAVVHRLSGWKLRTLLTPPDAPTASTFDEKFVRTNIVAGFIMADGRFVVARLPQADAEMLNLSAAFRHLKLPADTGETGLLLIRPDGAEFAARFVGFDASTGLSLLESDKPLVSPVAEIKFVPPVVGQRVRVIAPVRAAAPVAPPSQPTIRPEDAPVGEEGVIYMNMSEEQGRLREITRSPSGRATAITVDVKHISPEWTGGVALSETGTLVGIIDESHEREMRLLSAEIVRGAANRVKARRASVPQPWLGASGDALAFVPLDALVARGWPREQARTLLDRRLGVLLTSVAPGTPAALAGLRAGDVIARIGDHDVRGIEDMSSLMRELGGNALAHFTVLRAQSAPRSFPVHLSESRNPLLDTARAELRAARSDLRATSDHIRRAQEAESRLAAELRKIENDVSQMQASETALRFRMQKDLSRVREQFRGAREQAQQARADYQLLSARVAEAEARFRAASELYAGLAVKPLLALGLEAIAVSLADATFSAGRGSGLLVMAVQPGSAAAQDQLLPGDIIETINGQPSCDANWNFNFSTNFDLDLSLGILREGEKLTLKLSRQNAPR